MTPEIPRLQPWGGSKKNFHVAYVRRKSLWIMIYLRLGMVNILAVSSTTLYVLFVLLII